MPEAWVTSAEVAWDVVVSGGGFGGLFAARALERAMPESSTRITLVNDVNFLLYTPFLPEAAAGMLEPRHVVTPLRDVLLAIRACGWAPVVGRAGRAGRSPTATWRAPSTSCATTGWWSRTDRSRACSRSRAWPSTPVGFKSLADAIWLRNHVVACLETADETEDDALCEELLTFVFVGGGYAGLEALAELQDFAAEALRFYPRARLHGMRWILVEAADRVLLGDGPKLADYACRELRGRGIDIRLGTTLEEVTGNSARISTGETIPPRPWCGPPAWSRTRACGTWGCRWTSAAASAWTTTCWSRASRPSGRSATAPRCRTRRRAAGSPARRHPSTQSGRDARPAATSRRRWASVMRARSPTRRSGSS